MKPRHFATAIAIAVAVILAGCAARPGASPSTPSTPAPTSGPLDHPTGPADLILRFDEGGGFVPANYLVTQAPAFSLYGDGTAIFRDPSATAPEPIGGVTRLVPFQVVRLSEADVQALLSYAIGPGGLGVARAQYTLPIADAPTATFTLVVAGRTRTVSVNGLGIDVAQTADAEILAKLAALRTRLLGFAHEANGATMWRPDRYRGILMDGVTGTPVAWPWPTVSPSDFVLRTGPTEPPFPARTMSPTEVAALAMAGLEGGEQGLVLRSPDSAEVLYGLALRPLLPDEPH
jgi:hypothetical protein